MSTTPDAISNTENLLNPESRLFKTNVLSNLWEQNFANNPSSGAPKKESFFKFLNKRESVPVNEKAIIAILNEMLNVSLPKGKLNTKILKDIQDKEPLFDYHTARDRDAIKHIAITLDTIQALGTAPGFAGILAAASIPIEIAAVAAPFVSGMVYNAFNNLYIKDNLRDQTLENKLNKKDSQKWRALRIATQLGLSTALSALGPIGLSAHMDGKALSNAEQTEMLQGAKERIETGVNANIAQSKKVLMQNDKYAGASKKLETANASREEDIATIKRLNGKTDLTPTEQKALSNAKGHLNNKDNSESRLNSANDQISKLQEASPEYQSAKKLAERFASISADFDTKIREIGNQDLLSMGVDLQKWNMLKEWKVSNAEKLVISAKEAIKNPSAVLGVAGIFFALESMSLVLGSLLSKKDNVERSKVLEYQESLRQKLNKCLEEIAGSIQDKIKENGNEDISLEQAGDLLDMAAAGVDIIKVEENKSRKQKELENAARLVASNEFQIAVQYAARLRHGDIGAALSPADSEFAKLISKDSVTSKKNDAKIEKFDAEVKKAENSPNLSQTIKGLREALNKVGVENESDEKSDKEGWAKNAEIAKGGIKKLLNRRNGLQKAQGYEQIMETKVEPIQKSLGLLEKLSLTKIDSKLKHEISLLILSFFKSNPDQAISFSQVIELCRQSNAFSQDQLIQIEQNIVEKDHLNDRIIVNKLLNEFTTGIAKAGTKKNSSKLVDLASSAQLFLDSLTKKIQLSESSKSIEILYNNINIIVNGMNFNSGPSTANIVQNLIETSINSYNSGKDEDIHNNPFFQQIIQMKNDKIQKDLDAIKQKQIPTPPVIPNP